MYETKTTAAEACNSYHKSYHTAIATQQIRIEEAEKILTCLFSEGDDDVRITANCITNNQIDSPPDSNPQKTHKILHF